VEAGEQRFKRAAVYPSILSTFLLSSTIRKRRRISHVKEFELGAIGSNSQQSFITYESDVSRIKIASYKKVLQVWAR
jgi:hypothetical protein